MTDHRSAYIRYRVEKSEEAFKDAKVLAAHGSWNASVNRLYYSCYYLISALLFSKNENTFTHAGLKNRFNLLFVKSGKISIENGKLFSDLMDWRQKGDYGDMFDFDRETVEPMIMLVEVFPSQLRRQIEI